MSRRQLILITILAWLSMLGFDFFLHAGLLAELYTRQSPFLLPPLRSFQLIPLGYLAFLLVAILLVWLMRRLSIRGSRQGFLFALAFGALSWGATILGLASISTADVDLLAGWFFGQVAELGIAGAVIGSGFAGTRLTRLAIWVILFVILCLIVTIAMQTAGIVPTTRF
jgi:hypothetical protein